MNEQKQEQWIELETEDGTLGMPLEMEKRIREEKRPVLSGEEQKRRVVSRLMSRLWEEN